MTDQSSGATTQRDHWHCMNCGGSEIAVETVECTVFGEPYEIEKCANCGAVEI